MNLEDNDPDVGRTCGQLQPTDWTSQLKTLIQHDVPGLG